MHNNFNEQMKIVFSSGMLHHVACNSRRKQSL